MKLFINIVYYIITRLWNRLIFGIIYICVKMIWDSTKKNGAVFEDVNRIFDYWACILADKKEYKKFKVY